MTPQSGYRAASGLPPGGPDDHRLTRALFHEEPLGDGGISIKIHANAEAARDDAAANDARRGGIGGICGQERNSIPCDIRDGAILDQADSCKSQVNCRGTHCGDGSVRNPVDCFAKNPAAPNGDAVWAEGYGGGSNAFARSALNGDVFNHDVLQPDQRDSLAESAADMPVANGDVAVRSIANARGSGDPGPACGRAPADGKAVEVEGHIAARDDDRSRRPPLRPRCRQPNSRNQECRS